MTYRLLLFGGVIGVVLFFFGYLQGSLMFQFGGFALTGSMFVIYMLRKLARK